MTNAEKNNKQKSSEQKGQNIKETEKITEQSSNYNEVCQKIKQFIEDTYFILEIQDTQDTLRKLSLAF